ncbi:hypothetical protein TcasGA2_TC013122 [Tribolium castaneum]|uniref:Uncharacterized protein n=1 Tax=Tribolium castaneum TaxID=7070 RepID=D6WNW5_TRICA|nr:hypothetical protein TcasGA2_TC013122 [Tribolium castaneum]
MQPFRFSRRASGKRAQSCQSVTRRPPMTPRLFRSGGVRARMTISLSHQVRKGTPLRPENMEQHCFVIAAPTPGHRCDVSILNERNSSTEKCIPRRRGKNRPEGK